MKIVGLDLSLTGTGICRSDGTVSTVRTRLKDGDERLRIIRGVVADAVNGADLAVIEDLPVHAKAAGITGKVHGVVDVLLMDMGIPYVTIPPATLKKFATGAGNCDKIAMGVAAFKRDKREFADDNQCDAWWLWIAGLTATNHCSITLPAAQVKALDAVTWPELADGPQFATLCAGPDCGHDESAHRYGTGCIGNRNLCTCPEFRLEMAVTT